MPSPIGLQQLLNMQGFEWGDGPSKRTIWLDGGNLYTDAVFSPTIGALTAVAPNGSGNGIVGQGYSFTSGTGGGANSTGGAVTFTMGGGTGTGSPGTFSIVPATGILSTAGQILLGAAGNTYTNATGAVTSLLRLNGQFNGTAADSTSATRILTVEPHWTDSTNGASTFCGGYFFAYHDGAGTDVQDLIGLIGRAYITSTGISSVGMWGVRGDCNFTGAGTGIVSASSVVGHQGTWTAAATITTYSQLEAKSLNCSSGGAIVTNGFGVYAQVPTNATIYNAGVNIGTPPTATGPYTIGLNVNTNGAWFRGAATLPAHTDTTNTSTIIALLAGSNTGANDPGVLIYFYRSSTAQGFFGFDGNVSQVAAGHTKLVSDMVLGSDKTLVDTAGAIWSAASINGNSMSIIPAVKTSGSLSGAFTYTGAAHTGITAGSFAEFSFNAGRVVTFDGTGSPTAATGYTFNFLKPTYTASTATFTITEAATMRISGPPATSAAGGFTPVLTNAWALLVAAGSSSFAGAIVQGHNLNAINSTATASAAAVAGGYITSTSAAPTTITLPTGTALGAALAASQGTIHDLYIDNTAGSSTVTIAVNTNAILSAEAAAVAASAGLLTVPSGVTGQACFRLMFSSATAYTFTRIA